MVALGDDLLESGVEIYELRPDSAMKEDWSLLSTQSRAGLHAKTLLVDGRRAVIGSYNLDPRSADINTELVLPVKSPVFGERLKDFLDDGVTPDGRREPPVEWDRGAPYSTGSSMGASKHRAA